MYIAHVKTTCLIHEILKKLRKSISNKWMDTSMNYIMQGPVAKKGH